MARFLINLNGGITASLFVFCLILIPLINTGYNIGLYNQWEGMGLLFMDLAVMMGIAWFRHKVR